MKAKALIEVLQKVNPDADIAFDLKEIFMVGYEISIKYFDKDVVLSFVSNDKSITVVACIHCHKYNCVCR